MFSIVKVCFSHCNFSAVTVGFDEMSRTVTEDVGNIFIPVTIAQDVPFTVTVDIVFGSSSANTDGTILISITVSSVVKICQSITSK